MTALLITLPEIAALARVQRPVVSMWRARFAAGDVVFPSPVQTRDGQDQFDAAEIAHWLSSTGHGNNADAVADLAAFATPLAWSGADSRHADTLSALIALRAADGLPIEAGELNERARAVDPDDACLASEVESRDRMIDWGGFVDQFIDAAFSPQGAWSRAEGRRNGEGRAGVAGPIADAPLGQLARLALELSGPEQLTVIDAPGALSAQEVVTAAVAQAGEHRVVQVHLPDADRGRNVRRHLLVCGLGHVRNDDPPRPGMPAVLVARLTGQDPAGELAALEDLVVDLSEAGCAIVLGPAAMLADQLAGSSEQSRDAMLRSGRVRAIVRLGAGWIPTATRFPLALWVIGSAQHEVPIADRFSVVGDVSAVDLTSARMTDLIGDVLAGLGGAPAARRHSFRYLRVVRTSALVAGGNLVASIGATSAGAPGHRAGALPAMIDEAVLALGEHAPRLMLSPVDPEAEAPAPAVSVGRAISAREARVLGGARLRLEDTVSNDGFAVLGLPEVRQGSASGRRIDRLRLLADYPRAELTLPGDVVFLAGAEPRAMVDHAGSNVVEYPARVLRLRGESLAPEVAAADINAQLPGSTWRDWRLRRLASGHKAGLARAIAEISAEREAAKLHLDRLTRLEHLVLAAVASGAAIADIPAQDLYTPTEGAA